MRCLVIILMLLTGCAIPPELKEQFDVLTNELTKTNQEYTKLKQDKDALNKLLNEKKISEQNFIEQSAMLNNQLLDKERQTNGLQTFLKQANDKISELNSQVIAKNISKTVNVTGHVLEIASPFVLPFFPFLAPILGGLGSVLNRFKNKESS